MSLLTQLMEHPLEPGYEAAAHRRAQLGQPPATRRHGVAVAAALVLGFVLAVSALTLRHPPTAAAQANSELIARIESERGQTDKLSAQIDALQTEIAQYQQAALDQTGNQGLQVALNQLSVSTGADALVGPGLQLTLDDAADAGAAPGADPRANQGFTDNRVQATDLQIIVNGLWQAGAEAISINGERLTARSAIRFAGSAILVDYRPLATPYVISVIGDPQALQTQFATTAAAGYLNALVSNYSIRSDLSVKKSITVPSSSSLSLTWAQVRQPSATSGQ